MIKGVAFIAAIGVLIGLLAAWIGFTGLPLHPIPPPTSGNVGVVSDAVTDLTRREFFATTGVRVVPFQILYSAATSGRTAPYISNAEPVVAAIKRNQGQLLGIALARLGKIAAPWTEGARPRSGGPYPVVIYLPGVTGYMQMSSFQTAALAADGFVVITIDQPGNVAAARLPDGRVIQGMSRDEAVLLTAPSYRQASLPPLERTRLAPDRSIVPYLAADVPAVIERLREINVERRHRLHGLLDLHAIGVMGVSLGAIVAAQACQHDAIKACLMMDAPVPTTVADTGLQKPALWLSRSAADQRSERAASGGWSEIEIVAQAQSLARVVSNSRNARVVTLRGLFHVDFTDLPAIQPLLGRIGMAGPIGVTRAHDQINAQTLDFFRQMKSGKHAEDKPKW